MVAFTRRPREDEARSRAAAHQAPPKTPFPSPAPWPPAARRSSPDDAAAAGGCGGGPERRRARSLPRITRAPASRAPSPRWRPAPTSRSASTGTGTTAPGSGLWSRASSRRGPPPPRTPARYTASCTDLVSEDGEPLVEPFVPSHLRPRSPPPSDDDLRARRARHCRGLPQRRLVIRHRARRRRRHRRVPHHPRGDRLPAAPRALARRLNFSGRHLRHQSVSGKSRRPPADEHSSDGEQRQDTESSAWTRSRIRSKKEFKATQLPEVNLPEDSDVVSREADSGSNSKHQQDDESNLTTVLQSAVARKKGFKESDSQHNSLDSTSTVQRPIRRKKAAGPLKKSSIERQLEGETHIQQQLDKTLEDNLNSNQVTNQVLLPLTPPGFESIANGKRSRDWNTDDLSEINLRF